MGWEGGGGEWRGGAWEGGGRGGARNSFVCYCALLRLAVCRIGTIVAKGEKDEGGVLVWVFCSFSPALCSLIVLQEV